MSILKVFDMMAGGVEFNHYFVEKKLAMPELARFICFTFILIMSISLMNLLVSKYSSTMPNDGQAFVNTQIIVIVVVVCLFVLLSVRSSVDFSFDVQESGLLLVYFYLNKDDFIHFRKHLPYVTTAGT